MRRLLLAVVLLGLVWSGFAPSDRFTWWLEVAPIFIGVPALIWLYTTLRLTPLTYSLIWLNCLILCKGNHCKFS